MPVIKGDGAAEATPERVVVGRPVRAGGVVNAEVFEARQSAQGIIEEAQRKAQSIVEAAEKERARVQEEARIAGYQEGLAQAAEVLLRAKIQAKEVISGAQNDVIELACRVAERIIGHELQREPEVMVDICATAVESLRQVKQMVLRVNPRDAGILRTRMPRFMEALGRTAEVAIKEDADVQSGGCIVQTEFGTIDAQLTTQFEMLRNVLLGDGSRRDGPK